MSSTRPTWTPGVSHRVVCLDRLARAVHAPSDAYFEWLTILMRRLCLVLWELPLHVQVGLAVATAERYLPVYEQKRLHRTQLRQFFARCLTADPPTDHDVDEWYGSLSWEDRGDLSDRALYGAATLAAEATRNVHAPTELTSACVLAVVDAIGACDAEARRMVDPEGEAADLEDLRRADLDLPPLPTDWSKYRSPWHMPEVKTAVFAGWDAVVAWLRAADVGQYPDHVDRNTLAWLLRELKKSPRVVHLPYPDRLQMEEEG